MIYFQAINNKPVEKATLVSGLKTSREKSGNMVCAAILKLAELTFTLKGCVPKAELKCFIL